MNTRWNAHWLKRIKSALRSRLQTVGNFSHSAACSTKAIGHKVVDSERKTTLYVREGRMFSSLVMWFSFHHVVFDFKGELKMMISFTQSFEKQFVFLLACENRFISIIMTGNRIQSNGLKDKNDGIWLVKNGHITILKRNINRVFVCFEKRNSSNFRVRQKVWWSLFKKITRFFSP